MGKDRRIRGRVVLENREVMEEDRMDEAGDG